MDAISVSQHCTNFEIIHIFETRFPLLLAQLTATINHQTVDRKINPFLQFAFFYQTTGKNSTFVDADQTIGNQTISIHQEQSIAVSPWYLEFRHTRTVVRIQYHCYQLLFASVLMQKAFTADTSNSHCINYQVIPRSQGQWHHQCEHSTTSPTMCDSNMPMSQIQEVN